MPGLSSSRGREAGRQAAGGGGKNFSFPVFSKPHPCFQAALQSPRLLRHHTQSARSGWKERLPPFGRDWGDRERGEDSEGALTPPRRKSSSVHPWGQRRLSWESSGDYTPAPHRIEALRPREALGLSRGTAANQLPTLTPILISWQLQSKSLLDLPLSSQAHLSLQKEKYLDPEAKFLFPSPGTSGHRDTPLTHRHPTPPPHNHKHLVKLLLWAQC